MKIKTQDLTGHALDWTVGICEGHKPKDFCFSDKHFRDEETFEWFCPSSHWGQAGPIIERECMDILCLAGGDDGWQADKYLHTEKVEGFGPTPLVAAMRCFVASRLGDEVDVPDELVKGATI